MANMIFGRNLIIIYEVLQLTREQFLFFERTILINTIISSLWKLIITFLAFDCRIYRRIFNHETYCINFCCNTV